jgi:hypothetical protein
MGILAGLILRAPTNKERSKLSSSPSLLGDICGNFILRKATNFSEKLFRGKLLSSHPYIGYVVTATLIFTNGLHTGTI